MLCYDANSKSQLVKAKKELAALAPSLRAMELPEETKRDLAFLLDWLENDDALNSKPARRPSLLRRLAGSTTKAAAVPTETSTTTGGKHSFVSYAWANAGVVHPFCEWMLRSKAAIWWDKINMGEDTIESMVRRRRPQLTGHAHRPTASRTLPASCASSPRRTRRRRTAAPSSRWRTS